VETKWWKNEEPLPLDILATKNLMVGWGRIFHMQKKKVFCLGGD